MSGLGQDSGHHVSVKLSTVSRWIFAVLEPAINPSTLVCCMRSFMPDSISEVTVLERVCVKVNANLLRTPRFYPPTSSRYYSTSCYLSRSGPRV